MHICVGVCVGSAHSMVKGDCVDDHELAKVILVGVVVAVPGYHIEWRVVLPNGCEVSYKRAVNFL